MDSATKQPATHTAQTVILCIITVIYLTFELAFNARLLDVVGVGASPDEIHAIEKYGRSLSGIAVALVVLQLMLRRRNKNENGRPSALRIALSCAASAVITYLCIQTFVDGVVATRSALFRREALNIVFVQNALVHGRARLAGLDDDPELFSKPEGKAFLAVFPGLATAASNLGARLEGAKAELVRQTITRDYGPGKLYDGWRKIRQEVASQWERYARQSGGNNIDSEIARQQDKAWGDYLRDLGKRGWTPSTVPGYAVGAVVKNVRKRLPNLPGDWEPADEETFRDAVASQVRSKMKGGGDGSVVLNGKRIPPGLSFEAFFAHPAVQGEVRRRLDLPGNVTVRSSYELSQVFQQTVYEPWLKHRIQSALADYSAPTSQFEDHGPLKARGEEAARAVLVPPIALFCSLLGAIGHFGKLIYLLLSLTARLSWRGEELPKPLGWAIAASPFVVIGLTFYILSQLDNAVTTSQVYVFLDDQARQRASQTPPDETDITPLLLGGMHAVAVGQGMAYPFNEQIRTQVLGGITYGYQGSI